MFRAGIRTASAKLLSTCVGLSVVLLTGAATQAADLSPPSAPAPVPVFTKAPPPAYSWTGFYAGADVGGAWARSDGRWDPMDNFDRPDPGYFGEEPFDGAMKGSGVLAGGHLGYNYQFAHSWVAGVEADWSWTNANAKIDETWISTDPIAHPGLIRPGAHTSLETDFDSIATFRARAGYLVVPSLLLYATGGFALADADLRAAAQNEPTNPTPYLADFSKSKWVYGSVVGGGLEYAFQNGWSLRAESLFYQFNTSDFTIAGDPSDATGNFCRVGCANTVFPSGFTRSNTDVLAARLGVSYKFY
jgi:outer membrane immunogenic protein